VISSAYMKKVEIEIDFIRFLIPLRHSSTPVDYPSSLAGKICCAEILSSNV
jgi:hypothetical protein